MNHNILQQTLDPIPQQNSPVSEDNCQIKKRNGGKHSRMQSKKMSCSEQEEERRCWLHSGERDMRQEFYILLIFFNSFSIFIFFVLLFGLHNTPTMTDFVDSDYFSIIFFSFFFFPYISVSSPHLTSPHSPSYPLTSLADSSLFLHYFLIIFISSSYLLGLST